MTLRNFYCLSVASNKQAVPGENCLDIYAPACCFSSAASSVNVSVAANALALLLCLWYKNRMFRQAVAMRIFKDKRYDLHYILTVTRLQCSWVNTTFDLPYNMHCKRFQFRFTCQTDFDTGPIPSSPRIRHHSGKTITQTSHSGRPKNTISLPKHNTTI